MNYEIWEVLLVGATLGVALAFICFWLWLNKAHREAKAKAEELEGVLREKFLLAIKQSAKVSRLKSETAPPPQGPKPLAYQQVDALNNLAKSLQASKAQPDQQVDQVKLDASHSKAEVRPEEDHLAKVSKDQKQDRY